jgi:hypothetical protein
VRPLVESEEDEDESAAGRVRNDAPSRHVVIQQGRGKRGSLAAARRHRAAFAAACAERLLPLCQLFYAVEGFGNSQALVEGLADFTRRSETRQASRKFESRGPMLAIASRSRR